jgi:hypothetical protein
MDMDMLWVGINNTVLNGSWELFFHFAILPACRPPMMGAMAFSSTFISNDI